MGRFISKIIIVGVGLIGGSIGLALKKRKLAKTVIGVDQFGDGLDSALRIGAIDRACADLEDALKLVVDSTETKPEYEKPKQTRPSELLIVCTPVGDVASIILHAAEIVGDSPLLITDVGSTKHDIQLLLLEKLPINVRYIGSHPIAGSEKSGSRFADPELFAKKLTVLTPTDNSATHDIAFLEHFWNLLGSSVVQIPAKQHDSILARTSHLPHLISAMLVKSLTIGDHIMIGSGFRSTTRLASGDPTVWADVFVSNKDAIFEAITSFEKQLGQFRELLSDGNYEGIKNLLEKTKKHRDALEK